MAVGYCESTARKHLQLMVHLDAWLEREGLDVIALASDQMRKFFQARRDAGYATQVTVRSAAPLLGYLRKVGVLPTAVPPRHAEGSAKKLTYEFGVLLERVRCLAPGTVRFYVRVAALFLGECFGETVPDLAKLRPGDVTRFVTRECEHRGVSSARQVVSALRSFLRFVQMLGLTTLVLDQAVLSVAGWSPSLPRAVDRRDVQRLLRGCDRRTRMGRRDYAIVTLLARLGLRGGEVAALRLEDIDWRAGQLLVRGKGGSRQVLPLPVDVGQAVAAYLRHGRPRADDREVFLRQCAPFTGLASSSAIRNVVVRASRRAGIAVVSPHRLRHSVGTDMLRAGVSLPEIRQVLRHRAVATTAVYAKADPEQVRALARHWPGGAA
jgi:site-specific recombinase XerD